MERENHTAEEIRAEIARLLEADPAKLPLPLLRRDRDPFDGGGNWLIPAWPSIKGDEARVGMAIVAVKSKWDLVG